MPIYSRIVNGQLKVEMSDPLKIVPAEDSVSLSSPRKQARSEAPPEASLKPTTSLRKVLNPTARSDSAKRAAFSLREKSVAAAREYLHLFPRRTTPSSLTSRP
jgi:hypothetical protein